jgi:ribose 1,5-bisphosphokinase PhnN
MSQTIVNIVYAEITAIVVMCLIVYLMYLNRKMMKRGPNDLDEIIDRLKKENKRLKSKIKTLVNTKFVDKVLSCKESM